MTFPPRFLLLLSFALLVASPSAYAQGVSTTDIIRGRVSDDHGQPVAAAQVAARSVATGVRRETSTGADGRFTIVFPDGGGRCDATRS